MLRTSRLVAYASSNSLKSLPIVTIKKASSSSSCTVFSYTNAVDNKLFLCLDKNHNSDTRNSDIPTWILHPLLNINLDSNSSSENEIATSAEEVVKLIDHHYDNNNENFVGGMGESDLGVWFVPASVGVEPLQYWEFIQESIQLTKEHRHGVNFGVYTSGISHYIPINATQLGKQGLNLSSCQITLGSGFDPISYQTTFIQTNKDGMNIDEKKSKKCFLSVCNFIVNAIESESPPNISCATFGDPRVNELATNLGALECEQYELSILNTQAK